MSEYARVILTLDIRVDEGESLPSTIRDLCDGLSEADSNDVKVLALRSELVEDKPKASSYGQVTFNDGGCCK